LEIKVKSDKDATGCERVYDFEVDGTFHCGRPTSYDWYIQDDDSSKRYINTAKPKHKYNTSGKLKVEVVLYFKDGSSCQVDTKVDVDYCKITGFSKIRWKNRHTFTFKALIPKVNFCDDYDEIIKLVWNFGDNTPERTSTNPYDTITHSYATNGTYKVKLTIYTKKGCVMSFYRQVTAKKTDCCYYSDNDTKTYPYNLSGDKWKIEHSYAVNKVALRFVVKSINFKEKKNKPGNWERKNANRLRVNYKGIVYKGDCQETMPTNGNALSNTNKNSITYDKGYGKHLMIKKQCTWSTYEVDNGSYKSGEQTGIYLHTKCD
jgi:hypothetical protein